MIKRVFGSLIFALAFSGLCFLVSEDFYLLGGVFASYFLAMLFLILPMIGHSFSQRKKRHESYRFINTYLITLSVTSSPRKSYEAALEGSSGELLEISGAILQMNDQEKITYLASYFGSAIYRMFLDVCSLCQEQGGDVLKLSNELLQELARLEQNGDALDKESDRKLKEFFLLWLMSLSVLVFVRFGLSSFYGYLLKSAMFKISVLVYFAFALVAFLVFFREYGGGRIPWPKWRPRRKA